MLKIRNWTIKKTKSGVCVEGIVRNHGSGELWHSNTIRQRISNNVLRTLTGSSYRLVGKLNADLDSNVPSEILKKFKHGFPDDWETLIQEWRGPVMEDCCNDEVESKITKASKVGNSKQKRGKNNNLITEAVEAVNETVDCILTRSFGLPPGTKVGVRRVCVSGKKTSGFVNSVKGNGANARKRQSVQNSDDDISVMEEAVTPSDSSDVVKSINRTPLIAQRMRKPSKCQSKTGDNLDLITQPVSALTNHRSSDSTPVASNALNSVKVPSTGRVRFRCLKNLVNANPKKSAVDGNKSSDIIVARQKRQTSEASSGKMTSSEKKNNAKNGVVSCLLSPPHSILSDTRCADVSNTANKTMPTDFLLTALESQTSPGFASQKVLYKVHTPLSVAKTPEETVVRTETMQRMPRKSRVSFLALKSASDHVIDSSAVSSKNSLINRAHLCDTIKRRWDTLNKTHDVSDIICKASLSGLADPRRRRGELLAPSLAVPATMDKKQIRDTCSSRSSSVNKESNAELATKISGVDDVDALNIDLDEVALISDECATSEVSSTTNGNKNIEDKFLRSESEINKPLSSKQRLSRKRQRDSDDVCSTRKRRCVSRSSVSTHNSITERNVTPSTTGMILRSASRHRTGPSPVCKLGMVSFVSSAVKGRSGLLLSQNSVCKALKNQFVTAYGNKSLRVLCTPLARRHRSLKSTATAKVGSSKKNQSRSVVLRSTRRRAAKSTGMTKQAEVNDQTSKRKQIESKKVSDKCKKVSDRSKKVSGKSKKGGKTKISSGENATEKLNDSNVVVNCITSPGKGADAIVVAEEKESNRKSKSVAKCRNVAKGKVDGSKSVELEVQSMGLVNEKGEITKKLKPALKSASSAISKKELENKQNSAPALRNSEAERKRGSNDERAEAEQDTSRSDYYVDVDDSEIILKVPKKVILEAGILYSNPRSTPRAAVLKSVSSASLTSENDISLVRRSSELNLSIEEILGRPGRSRACFQDGIRTSTPRKGPMAVTRAAGGSADINDSVELMTGKIRPADEKKVTKSRQSARDGSAVATKRRAMKDITKAKTNEPGLPATSGSANKKPKEVLSGKKTKANKGKVTELTGSKRSTKSKATEDVQEAGEEEHKATGKKSSKEKGKNGGGLGGKGTLKRRKNLREMINDHDDEMSACNDIFSSTPYGRLKDGKLADLYGKELTDLTMLTMDGSCMTGSLSRSSMVSVGLTPHRMLMGSMYDSSSIQKTPFGYTPSIPVPTSRRQNTKHIDNFINGVLKERQRKCSRRKLSETDANDSNSAIPLARGRSAQAQSSAVDILRRGPLQADVDPEESVDNYFDETLQ